MTPFDLTLQCTSFYYTVLLCYPGLTLLEVCISCQCKQEDEFPGGYCLFNSVGLLLFHLQCLNKTQYAEATAVYASSPHFTASELTVASPLPLYLSLN